MRISFKPFLVYSQSCSCTEYNLYRYTSDLLRLKVATGSSLSSKVY